LDAIDRDIFDALKIRMKGKFSVLLGGYLRDAKAYLVNIETNIPDGDCDAIIEAAHCLKSASALLGVTQVSQSAETLEYAAKHALEEKFKNLSILIAHHEDVQGKFSAVQDELEKELSRLKAV